MSNEVVFNNSIRNSPWIPHQVFTPRDRSHLFYTTYKGKSGMVSYIKDSLPTEFPHPLARYSQSYELIRDAIPDRKDIINDRKAKTEIDPPQTSSLLVDRSKRPMYPLLKIDMSKTDDEVQSLRGFEDSSFPTSHRPHIETIREKEIRENFEIPYIKHASGKESFGLRKPKYSNKDVPGSSGSMVEMVDYSYLHLLQSRALLVSNYVKNNKYYSKWSKNWDLLEKNLKRTGYLFERLNDSDADVAYVVNKGEEIKFRIRDRSRYIPINVFQYVLYHEMAHMCTHELQHTKHFQELLSLLCFAAFENGLLDFNRYEKYNTYYTSDGTPILSKDSMKTEVLDGARLLKEANSSNEKYYSAYIRYVSSL